MLLRGLSARETESGASPAAVRHRAVPASKAGRSRPASAARQFVGRLCARVQVRHNASGKGRVVIHYNSLDELDGIITRVK